MDKELKTYYQLEKIVFLTGKLKPYLKDLVDTKNMTIEQFKDSVTELKEVVFLKEDSKFQKLIHTITEKKIGIRTQNFEYAASMRDKENELLCEIAGGDFNRMSILFLQNVGYYLIYL